MAFLTSNGVVVGLVQVKPQVGQVPPDGGLGGVDAGDPFAGQQGHGGRRAPGGLSVRLGLAREVEEAALVDVAGEPPAEPALVRDVRSRGVNVLGGYSVVSLLYFPATISSLETQAKEQGFQWSRF